MRRILIPAVFLAITACSGTSSVGGTPITAGSPNPIDVHVPRLIGLSLAKARSAAEHRGLLIGHVKYRRTAKPRRLVIRQTPPPGIYLRPGQIIDVTVSTGDSHH